MIYLGKDGLSYTSNNVPEYRFYSLDSPAPTPRRPPKFQATFANSKGQTTRQVPTQKLMG